MLDEMPEFIEYLKDWMPGLFNITIAHEDGNTITGTPEQVLNHGHLKDGWRVVE